MASTTFKDCLDSIYTKKEVWGLYAYVEVESGEVVYIGVDRHIDTDERHKDHIKPSKATKESDKWQPINEALVDNKDKYEYIILVPYIIDKDLAQYMEVQAINHYNPKFNSKKKQENKQ